MATWDNTKISRVVNMQGFSLTLGPYKLVIAQNNQCAEFNPSEFF